MKTNEPFDPKVVARSLDGHLQDAVGDVASEMVKGGSGFNDDKWDRKIKKAHKDGVRDLQGWLADELYNDPDTISDLIGDRLYDECDGDKEKQLRVLEQLGDGAHPGMKKACKQLRKLIES